MGIDVNQIQDPAVRRRILEASVAKPETVKRAIEPRLLVSTSTDVDKLNKTERAWYAYISRQGHAWVGVQNVTLKLGDDCRYTPDFVVVTADGLAIAYEVKGFMRDDAQVKLKTAARQFPWFKFVLVKMTKGQFTQEEINT